MKSLNELKLMEETAKKVSAKTAKEVLDIAVESYASSMFHSYMGGSMMARGDVDVDKILKLITGKSMGDIAKMGETKFKEKVAEQAKQFDKNGQWLGRKK